MTRLAHTLGDFDLKYLGPERGVVSDNDIAEGHLYGLQLLTTAVELFANSDHHFPGTAWMRGLASHVVIEENVE